MIMDVRAMGVLISHGHTLAALAGSAQKYCQYGKDATDTVIPAPGAAARQGRPHSF